MNDASGAPDRLVSPDGQIACELMRTPWGKTTVAPGARTTTALRFQGQYEDEETGLAYNRARYYEPDAGRFISWDPQGPAGGPSILNIGWLERDQRYEQGQVSGEDIAAIERLAVHTWQPMYSKGWHDCSICGETSKAGPIMRTIPGKSKLLGADIIFVPHGDILYAAPTLILHYIDTHGYRPPEEFLRGAGDRSDER